MKDVNTQNLWTCEVVCQESNNMPAWILVRFQLGNRLESNKRNDGTLSRPAVTNGQCTFGTQQDPDASIIKNFDDDNCSDGHVQLKESFKALRKNDIVQPQNSDHDFRFSNRDIDDKTMFVKTYLFSRYVIRKTSLQLNH